MITGGERWRTVGGLTVAAVFVLPLVFLVLGSLRPPGLDPPDGFELLPPDPTLRNYQIVFQILPLWRNIANSLFVVALAVPLTVFVASLAGFAMARSTGRI
ncbi:MAG: carbohydrate ABC transporter permease, partial [Actinomycetota bacterium]